MGHAVSRTLEKWDLNPRKLSLKRSPRRATHAPSHQLAEAHIYDSVAVDPEYSKVNKKRTTDAEDVHYADIQVLQSGSAAAQERQKVNNFTEYATIDFLRSVSKTQSSPAPADILIPPGELRRPASKPKSTHKKKASSQRAVMV